METSSSANYTSHRLSLLVCNCSLEPEPNFLLLLLVFCQSFVLSSSCNKLSNLKCNEFIRDYHALQTNNQTLAIEENLLDNGQENRDGQWLSIGTHR